MKKRCCIILLGLCSIFFYCSAPRGGWYILQALTILRKHEKQKNAKTNATHVVQPINTSIKKKEKKDHEK